MSSTIEESFSTDDPEKTAKLAVTIAVAVVAFCILYAAIQVFCLAGETVCCFMKLLNCIRRICGCCTCGSQKNNSDLSPTTTDNAPRKNAGQYGSCILMVIAILTALVWQNYFATAMHESPATQTQWEQYCHEGRTPSYPQCAKFQSAYRVSFCTTVFFFVMACLTSRKPQLHDEAWDVKIFAWVVLLIAFTFAPNGVFLVYLWFARVFAFIFLILQQIILIVRNHLYCKAKRVKSLYAIGANRRSRSRSTRSTSQPHVIFLMMPRSSLACQQDSAYSLNAYFAEKGFEEQAATGSNGLNKWLCGLLGLSLGTLAAAVTGLALLFAYFGGCDTSDTFNSLALILILAFTVCQLLLVPEEGTTSNDTAQANSLLTSAVMAGYVVYLTFVADSANPKEECNPFYNQKENVLSVALGLGVTFITLCGTVYFASDSMTSLVASSGVSTQRDLETVLTEGAEKGGDGRTSTAASSSDKARPSLSRMLSEAEPGSTSVGTASKFNAVMMLISCYWCCVLTDWGNPGGGASSASPTAGTTAMWMNIVASWVCSLLYSWTIVAPKLFPDRDFS